MRKTALLLALAAASPLPLAAYDVAPIPFPFGIEDDESIPDEAIREILARAKIEPAPKGVLRFLRDQGSPPSAENAPKIDEARIQAHIKNLGHDEFEIREKAMRDLRELGRTAEPFLKAAAKSGDPEVRSRVESLLAELQPAGPAEQSAIHDAAMHLLQRHPSEPGTAAALVEFWPRFKGTEAGRVAMIQAAGAAARSEEGNAKLEVLDRLVSILEAPDTSWRVQAAARNTLEGFSPSKEFFRRGAVSWRRWLVSIGGKAAPLQPEPIPEEAIVVNVGLSSPAPKPSLEVAGKSVASLEEAIRAIEAEAKKRKPGPDDEETFVLVRYPPGLPGATLSELHAACVKAGVPAVRLRPIRPLEPETKKPPAPAPPDAAKKPTPPR